MEGGDIPHDVVNDHLGDGLAIVVRSWNLPGPQLPRARRVTLIAISIVKKRRWL